MKRPSLMIAMIVAVVMCMVLVLTEATTSRRSTPQQGSNVCGGGTALCEVDAKRLCHKEAENYVHIGKRFGRIENLHASFITHVKLTEGPVFAKGDENVCREDYDCGMILHDGVLDPEDVRKKQEGPSTLLYMIECDHHEQPKMLGGNNGKKKKSHGHFELCACREVYDNTKDWKGDLTVQQVQDENSQ